MGAGAGSGAPNGWVMGSWPVKETAGWDAAGRDIIMGGGSFHPAPLDTDGVNPGPGWSGT